MSETLSWINGVCTHAIDSRSRGLAYGDGLFETILCKGRQPLLWRLHLRRLHRGCEALGLARPKLSWLSKLLNAIRSPYSVLKLIVVRGGAATGYAPAGNATDVIAQVWPYQPTVAAPLTVADCNTVTLAHNASLAGIKHLGKIEYVQAARTAAAMKVDELLLFDGCGQLVEAISSNVFVRLNGRWVTPAIEQAGVAGVMRCYLLATVLPRLNMPCDVRTISRAEVAAADAMFLSNSIRGVVAVGWYQGRALLIPASQPIVDKLAGCINA